MENASKALLMAAAVLIGILVLTLIVYLYANFSSIKADNMEKMNQTSLEAFNGKYFAYDGRTDLTYYDIANIATMAKNDNENNGSDIWVGFADSVERNIVLPANNYYNYNNFMNKLQDKSKIDDSRNSDGSVNKNSKIMEIKDVSDEATGGTKEVKVLVKYKCYVEISQNDNTGRVKTIKFEKVVEKSKT